MNIRTVSLAALLAASLFALPATADSDELSAMAALETLELTPGGNTTLQVRSPRIGAMVTIFTDPLLGMFDLGPGLPLLCLPPTLTVVASGTIGLGGTFSVSVLTPAAGTTFSVQAVVVDGNTNWFASRCRTLTVPPSTPPVFVNDSASLDPATALYSASDVDFADLNRDGCPDAIIANDGTGSELLMLISDCTGTFSSEAMFRLPASALRPTSTVEMADVNNDGHVDLFLGGGSDPVRPGKNLLLINDGSGFFELANGTPVAPNPNPNQLVRAFPCPVGTNCLALPGGAGYAADAEFGDLDDDGDLDLFVINTTDFDYPSEIAEPVTLYFNQGGVQGGLLGSFVQDRAFTKLPGNQSHDASADVSVGDLDGDGDLDLFVSAVGVQNQLYVNDGTGTFTQATGSALPPEVDDSFEADLGDFDGDGDLDIIVANNISTDVTAIHFYENVTVTPGVPLFVDGSSRLPASFGPLSDIRLATDVGDIDGDGDLDVAMGIHELPGMGGAPDGETILLINLGGAQGGTIGTFAVAPSFAAGPFIVADLALEDIDLDGDLDIYIANSGNLFQTEFDDELWLND